MYRLAGNAIAAYYGKLGELTLQLAVVIIIGATIKALIDWGTAQQERHVEKREKKMDFMRRVRAAHIALESARELLNAHDTAKTYGEQLRRLMHLRFEVEEISEDLGASLGIFIEKEKIIDGLEGIVTYLKEGAREYIEHHGDVDEGFQLGRTLQATIDKKNMFWVKDLMGSGTPYKEKYVANLEKAKKTMRLEVFGA